MGGLQKLITVLGRFDNYRGEYRVFEFARVGLILTRGEERFWLIYEAYEVKQQRENL
jgi:hypothetical protein